MCDSFVVYLKVNQRAAVNWSATFHNPASVTPEQTADLAKLNARLANVSSSRRKVWFPSRELKIGVMYNVTVCGREVFQHQEACDTVAIRRVSNAIPRIMFPVSRIVIGPSIRIKFRGEFLNARPGEHPTLGERRVSSESGVSCAFLILCYFLPKLETTSGVLAVIFLNAEDLMHAV